MDTSGGLILCNPSHQCRGLHITRHFPYNHCRDRGREGASSGGGDGDVVVAAVIGRTVYLM